MKKIILLLSFIGFFTCGYSQVDVNSEVIKTGETLADSSEIYTVVEENPQFPGGDKARMKFLQENIKDPKSALENEIKGVAEEMPHFPGEKDAYEKFIKENLKYPKSALENKIKGTVYVSFVVEKDGSITNIKLLRGFHPDCDAEAIRIIKLFPKWIPGKQRGKVVRVQYNIPIRFVL